VHAFVVGVMGWPAERVLFYGHSIGSGPSSYLVSNLVQRKQPVAGLILQRCVRVPSPLCSCSAVLCCGCYLTVRCALCAAV
jgi:hypothetical protein